MKGAQVIAAFAFVGIVSSIAAGQPQEEARKRAVEALKAEAARVPKLAALEKEWAAKLAKKKDAELADGLTALRAELKELRAVKTADGFAPKLTLTEAGTYGKLPHAKAHAGTVIDRTSATIQTRTSPPGLDATSENVIVIVTGVDTAKWADGLPIDSPAGIFLVDTAKRGGKTYLRLSPLALTKEESDAIMKAAQPAGK